jgi:adenylate cyclase
MRKAFRLRISNSIILVNTVLIFVTGLVIILITSGGIQGTIYSMADTLIAEIHKSVENKTLAYLEPAEKAASSTSYLLWKGVLDDGKDVEGMLGYFRELLKSNAEFKMVYFADDAGNLSMARRMPDGSFTKRYVRRLADRVSIRYEHENPAYYGDFPNADDSLETGYDPRKRPWYEAAAKARGIAWTSLYIFATDRQPGFSCAMPVYRENGALRGVIAIDIGVAELSYFLGGLSITPGARVYIADAEGRVVAYMAKTAEDVARLMKTQKAADGATSYSTLPVADSGDPAMIALEALASSGALSEGSVALIEAGGPFLASRSSLSGAAGANMFIGVAVPEDDVMGVAKRNTLVVILFSGAMILAAIFVSIVLSQAIARPMRILSEEMAKIKNFVLDSDRTVETILTEINEMQSSFDGMKQGLNNFRKYVPADLVSELIRHKKEARLGGEKKSLSIFFSDIANFTSISEKTAPEDLIIDLCAYFEVMSRGISETGGTIDKYIGDSVMAFWGAPREVPNHAELACRAAISCRDRQAALARSWENKGKLGFVTRFGINSGEVIVGNMGDEKRMNFTCIGDAVNTASRLEGLNKAYGTSVIVSASTYQGAREGFEFRHLDRVAVKGKREGIDIYELIALKDDINPSVKKLYALYEEGLALYFERRWVEAQKRLAAVLKYKPGDGPAKVLASRIRAYVASPPPEDWGGVFESHEK